MHLTANQVVQLLWIHEKEPEVELEFTESELKTLHLELLSTLHLADSPYKRKLKTLDVKEIAAMIYTTKEPLFK